MHRRNKNYAASGPQRGRQEREGWSGSKKFVQESFSDNKKPSFPLVEVTWRNWTRSLGPVQSLGTVEGKEDGHQKQS